MPSRPPEEVRAIAHRGASLDEPENTMRAFRAALDRGADAIEVDVWLSAEGVPVIHHDRLLRAGRKPARIHRLPLERIRAVRPEAPVPTLEEVLRWADGRIGVYAELKGKRTPESVVRLLRELDMSEKVLVGSFDPDLVWRVREAAPEVPTSILVREPDPALLVRLGRELGTSYVHASWRRARNRRRLLEDGAIEVAREAGMGFIVWWEDREEELRRLIELGPDAILTNAPERLVRVREDVRRRLRSGEERAL